MLKRYLAIALLAVAAACFIAAIHVEMTAFCALFFAAILLILSSKKTSEKMKKFARIIGISAFAVLTLLIGVICFAGHDDPVQTKPDFVVVLGAQTLGEEPGNTLRERLDRAIAYAETDPDAILFVTGARGSDEKITEAEVMANYLIRNGIDAERIVLEPESKTTRENLINAAKLAEEMGLDSSKPLIITSDFHLLRAKYIASTLSMNASGLASKTHPLVLKLNYALREIFAFVKAFVIAHVR